MELLSCNGRVEFSFMDELRGSDGDERDSFWFNFDLSEWYSGLEREDLENESTVVGLEEVNESSNIILTK